MNASRALPDFNDEALAKAVEALTEDEIDQLPFGTIRLDESGVVRFYSSAERRLSGSGTHERLGLNLLTQIAPCMNTKQFRERLEQARRSFQLDIEFSHIGDFNDRMRELTIRVQSASAGGVWLFLKREE